MLWDYNAAVKAMFYFKFRWIVDLEGAPESLYRGEKFKLFFKFGDRYPFDSPQVQCIMGFFITGHFNAVSRHITLLVCMLVANNTRYISAIINYRTATYIYMPSSQSIYM